MNHPLLFLLELNDSTLNTVLNHQSCDGAHARLADTMDAIGCLPLNAISVSLAIHDMVNDIPWIPPGVYDEDIVCLDQVQGDTTRLERHKEDLNVNILHKVLNHGIPLRRAHGSLQHNRLEPRTTETPFDELQHGSVL